MKIIEFKIKVNIIDNNKKTSHYTYGYDENGFKVIDDDEDDILRNNKIEIDLSEIEQIYKLNYSIEAINNFFPKYEFISKDIYNCNNLSEFIDFLIDNEDEDDEYSFEFINGTLQCGTIEYRLAYNGDYTLNDIDLFFDTVNNFDNYDHSLFNAIMEYYGLYNNYNVFMDDIMGKIEDCNDGSFTLIDDLDSYTSDYMHDNNDYTDHYDDYIDYEQYAKDNWNITETNHGWLMYNG